MHLSFKITPLNLLTKTWLSKKFTKNEYLLLNIYWHTEGVVWSGLINLLTSKKSYLENKE